MAVINQNNLVPPAPPTHHPAARPGEAPRVVQSGSPRPMNPEYLVHQMGRLNVQPERLLAATHQRPKEATTLEEIDARAPFYYLGYTFFKADAQPGHKSTWSQVGRTKMTLNQTELFKLVHKRTKKTPIAEQYQSLSKVKRVHVDKLISELRKSDPHFEWTCVYVKEEEKPVKGKNSRRGDYETLSMDVIIMRKATDLVFPKISVDDHVDVETFSKPKDRVPTHIHNHPSDPGSKPMPRNMQPSEPLVGPTIHQGPMPPTINNVQQPPPVRFHPPPIQPPQGYPGSRPHMAQGPWPWMHGMPAGMHPHHLPSGMPATTMHSSAVPMSAIPRPAMASSAIPRPAMSGPAMSGNAPHMETKINGVRGFPIAPGVQHQRHVFDPRPNPPHQPETHPVGRPNASAAVEDKPETVRPVTPAAEPEVELGVESSSVGDDESVFDFDDESSVTDSSDDELELHDKPQPWRGSLYRRHSTPRTKPYRTHYRKQPQRNGSDNKSGRSGYPTGCIDVVPADSKHVDPRTDSGPGPDVSRPARDRPKIIHAPVSADDLDLELLDERNERFRWGRARNDIRTQLLDDREAQLELREQMVEIQARMLEQKERLNEARYLGRRLSLREPGPFYAPRSRYMPEDLQ
ncbi:uncharacterized protein BO80DRAFT_369289 [Aspergillus ibericus CBS 121593]|uniref:Uncharacterized protein n=1 Tax=Aspergillus ibericus CBS 121593 TaxID=1448316 RepID=A0A395GIH8_9EURO|nr:hypothetical protein BO80DRAFT_369289 [Aspergillus ibericus CBS 121593]RAK95239.1 hypothetical protein BO80DRAFT_369289 [Aspergillus ibericus CBS 121593]